MSRISLKRKRLFSDSEGLVDGLLMSHPLMVVRRISECMSRQRFV